MVSCLLDCQPRQSIRSQTVAVRSCAVATIYNLVESNYPACAASILTRGFLGYKYQIGINFFLILNDFW